MHARFESFLTFQENEALSCGDSRATDAALEGSAGHPGQVLELVMK
jgi:hypothetical protein